jgi:hypothetical protein
MTGRTTAAKPKGTQRDKATSLGSAQSGTIALVINTKNEEAKLAAAIASCVGVDDIVVADMGSTDETVTIAKAAGARILELPDVGYCEPGRQAAIDAASAEWVLLLDADERLSPGGLDRLRQVVATAPAHVSSYLLPRPTQLKGETILGTGWSINLERQARLFRRDQVAWPTKIHGFPTFTGAVVELPEGTDVVIFHECFDDLTHAYRKFNTYSGVEAAERVAAGLRSTWVDALRDGIAEIERRYEPEIDGGLSLGLTMGMFFYRFGTHVKAMEISDTLRDAPMPPASVMRSAWGSLWSTLRDHEIAATRERIGRHLSEGNLALGVAALNEALLTWGLVPDLLVESAVVAHTAGDDHNARSFCEQALAIDPTHAEARTTALALDVVMGRRTPVRSVFIDQPPGLRTNGTVAVALDDSGGHLEASLDSLPFAPASLLRIQISLETLLAFDEESQDAAVAHLLTLLVPDGRLELVRRGPESLMARWPGSLLVVDGEPVSS